MASIVAPIAQMRKARKSGALHLYLYYIKKVLIMRKICPSYPTADYKDPCRHSDSVHGDSRQDAKENRQGYQQQRRCTAARRVRGHARPSVYRALRSKLINPRRAHTVCKSCYPAIHENKEYGIPVKLEPHCCSKAVVNSVCLTMLEKSVRMMLYDSLMQSVQVMFAGTDVIDWIVETTLLALFRLNVPSRFSIFVSVSVMQT